MQINPCALKRWLLMTRPARGLVRETKQLNSKLRGVTWPAGKGEQLGATGATRPAEGGIHSLFYLPINPLLQFSFIAH